MITDGADALDHVIALLQVLSATEGYDITYGMTSYKASVGAHLSPQLRAVNLQHLVLAAN